MLPWMGTIVEEVGEYHVLVSPAELPWLHVVSRLPRARTPIPVLKPGLSHRWKQRWEENRPEVFGRRLRGHEDLATQGWDLWTTTPSEKLWRLVSRGGHFCVSSRRRGRLSDDETLLGFCGDGHPHLDCRSSDSLLPSHCSGKNCWLAISGCRFAGNYFTVGRHDREKCKVVGEGKEQSWIERWNKRGFAINNQPSEHWLGANALRLRYCKVGKADEGEKEMGRRNEAGL